MHVPARDAGAQSKLSGIGNKTKTHERTGGYSDVTPDHDGPLPQPDGPISTTLMQCSDSAQPNLLVDMFTCSQAHPSSYRYSNSMIMHAGSVGCLRTALQAYTTE